MDDGTETNPSPLSEDELLELLDRAANAETEVAAFKILVEGRMPALEARDTAALMWLPDRYSQNGNAD